MIINFLRDNLHTTPGITAQTWAPTRISISSSIRMNSSGVVNQTSGMSHMPFVNLQGQGVSLWTGSGLLMDQPNVDATPYRVKAYAAADNAFCYLFCGYAPSSPTGVDDIITSVIAWPIGSVGGISTFNDLILLPALDEQSPDFGKPIAFGVAVAMKSGTFSASYNISVQNLAKTAPQFAASMS